MDRSIVVGDVHGCYFELRALLEEIGLRPTDRLFFVGDLITKGPASREVLDFVLGTRHCFSVLGNNEHALVCFWSGRNTGLTRSQHRIMASLGGSFGAYMERISGFPRFIDLGDFAIVHAGIRPGVALEQQTVEDLTKLRRLEDFGVPWFQRYEGEKTVVFGHWAFAAPLVRKNAVGIDTGCVYGESLTAVILPERRLVSIPAVKTYFQKEERSAGQHENVREASFSRPSIHR
jgi:serine/threonine protein phosphatase 1